jgi:hypothetical protein
MFTVDLHRNLRRGETLRGVLAGVRKGNLRNLRVHPLLAVVKRHQQITFLDHLSGLDRDRQNPRALNAAQHHDTSVRLDPAGSPNVLCPGSCGEESDLRAKDSRQQSVTVQCMLRSGSVGS